MRLFTAIELPDPLQRRLAKLGPDLVDGQWGFDSRTNPISFTRVENLHVTVKFLGELPEQDVPRVCDALGEAARLAGVGPLSLAVDGIELFPPRGPVRIVAAGVGGDADKLVLLHAAIEERCAELGVARENRPYRPHVTLARCKRGLTFGGRRPSPQGLRGIPRDAGWIADALVLMESRLHPTAPEYLPVARFAL